MSEKLTEREKRRRRAEENLKDHEYRCLIRTDEIEAWRCQRPNTTVYGFDIVATKYGLVAMGDIGDLTWRVGLSYGIEFLAGDDVDYYIHSKLTHECKRTSFDWSGVHEAAMNRAKSWLEKIDVSQLTEDDDFCELEQKTPEAVEEFLDKEVFGARTMEFDEWAERITMLVRAMHRHQSFSTVEDLQIEAFLDHYDFSYADGFDEPREAFDLLEEIGIEEPWMDVTVDVPHEGLMIELYMVNLAAKEIIKIKEAENQQSDSNLGEKEA